MGKRARDANFLPLTQSPILLLLINSRLLRLARAQFLATRKRRHFCQGEGGGGRGDGGKPAHQVKMKIESSKKAVLKWKQTKLGWV